MTILKEGYLKFDGLKHILDGSAVVAAVTGTIGPQGTTGTIGPNGNYSGTYYENTPTLTVGTYSATVKSYFIPTSPGDIVTLPSNPPIGYEVIVKDITGSASIPSYITISASGLVSFDAEESTDKFINTSFGYYRFLCIINNAGTKVYITLDTDS